MELKLGWISENFKIKVGMFFLAVMLWFLVVSEKSYDYSFDVPILAVGLRPGLTLAKPLPAKVRVHFHARGRELIRMLVANKPHVRLDLSALTHSRIVRLKSEMITIPGGLLVSVADIVTPDSVSVALDDFETAQVPVEPAITIPPAAGYTVLGNPNIDPPVIEVRGPEKALKALNHVQTDSLALSELKHAMEVEVRIHLPEGSGLETSTPTVKVSVKVERIGEKSIEGIKLQVQHAPRGKGVSLEPQAVRIIVSGAVSTVAGLQASDLDAWVDFNEAGSSSGWLKVHTRSPDGVEIRLVTPSEVRALVLK